MACLSSSPTSPSPPNMVDAASASSRAPPAQPTTSSDSAPNVSNTSPISQILNSMRMTRDEFAARKEEMLAFLAANNSDSQSIQSSSLFGRHPDYEPPKTPTRPRKATSLSTIIPPHPSQSSLIATNTASQRATTPVRVSRTMEDVLESKTQKRKEERQERRERRSTRERAMSATSSNSNVESTDSKVLQLAPQQPQQSQQRQQPQQRPTATATVTPSPRRHYPLHVYAQHVPPPPRPQYLPQFAVGGHFISPRKSGGEQVSQEAQQSPLDNRDLPASSPPRPSSPLARDADVSSSPNFPDSSPLTTPLRPQQYVNIVSSPPPMPPSPSPGEEPDPTSLPYPLPKPYGPNKPNCSYAALIGQAILASHNRALTLSDIYNWITTTYPYFKRSDSSWMNSIRHNLSLNECFVKMSRPDGAKGSMWSIRDEDLPCFADGGFKRVPGKYAPKRRKSDASSSTHSLALANSFSVIEMPLFTAAATASRSSLKRTKTDGDVSQQQMQIIAPPVLTAPVSCKPTKRPLPPPANEKYYPHLVTFPVHQPYGSSTKPSIIMQPKVEAQPVPSTSKIQTPPPQPPPSKAFAKEEESTPELISTQGDDSSSPLMPSDVGPPGSTADEMEEIDAEAEISDFIVWNDDDDSEPSSPGINKWSSLKGKEVSMSGPEDDGFVLRPAFDELSARPFTPRPTTPPPLISRPSYMSPFRTPLSKRKRSHMSSPSRQQRRRTSTSDVENRALGVDSDDENHASLEHALNRTPQRQSSVRTNEPSPEPETYSPRKFLFATPHRRGSDRGLLGTNTGGPGVFDATDIAFEVDALLSSNNGRSPGYSMFGRGVMLYESPTVPSPGFIRRFY